MDLNQREKILLTLAIVLLVPLIFFRFILWPLQDYQENMASKIVKTERKLKQVSLLGQELRYKESQARHQVKKLDRRVDSLLRQTKIKNRSEIVEEKRLNQKEQRVVVKLDEINLNELVNIIYQIENDKPVIRIKNIELINSFKNEKLFRARFILESE